MITPEEITSKIDNGKNLLITGKAGTGKSTLLRKIKNIYKDSCIVVAPTGVAAVNVEGTTIHSQFQLPISYTTPSKLKEMWGNNAEVLSEAELIIINEISMVRADTMDLIDERMRQFGFRNRPFGGKQLILFGDMFQISPVVREKEVQEALQNKYGGKYFYRAKCFENAEMEVVELEHIYRQTDENFIAALNRVRNGDVDYDVLCYFNQRVGTPLEDAIHMVTTNKMADSRNQKMLRSLEGESKTYRGKVIGDFPDNKMPNDSVLELKVGARVMAIRNDTENGAYINGSMGTVLELGTFYVKVEFDDGKRVRIEPSQWDNIKYRAGMAKHELIADVVGSYIQLPLKLAYAITIHKSQGMTFEKTHLDLGWGAFSEGQTYVALSRCTSLQGLTLQNGIKPKDIIVDPEILDYKSYFKGNENDMEELCPSSSVG